MADDGVSGDNPPARSLRLSRRALIRMGGTAAATAGLSPSPGQRPDQKNSLSPNWICLPLLNVLLTSPKLGLSANMTGTPKVAWFPRLKNSDRNSIW